jgi:hypothetical protein
MKEAMISRISEEDMVLAQNTADFLSEQTKIEDEISHFPTGSARRPDGSRPYSHGWPWQRAWHRATLLTGKEDSGIDVHAYNMMIEMLREAYTVNEAYDVVTSNGIHVEPVYDDKHIVRRLKGDNSCGMEQKWGSMVRVAGTQYDIKDGVAMRGSDEVTVSIAEIAEVGTTYRLRSSELGNYRPYPPQYQERAKELIRSLALKQMKIANEQNRLKEIRAAKAIIGRAGVKVPKF